jgi:hypothetical protein
MNTHDPMSSIPMKERMEVSKEIYEQLKKRYDLPMTITLLMELNITLMVKYGGIETAVHGLRYAADLLETKQYYTARLPDTDDDELP